MTPDDSESAAKLVDVHVSVPDRVGILAEFTTLATELHTEVFDLEISHSLEADRGTLVLTVSAASGSTLAQSLSDRGFEASVHPRAD